MHKRPSRLKNFFKTFFLLLFSTVVTILLAEALIRIAEPQRLDSIRGLFTADPDVVYRLKSNQAAVYSQFEFSVAESTNSIGLRDREIGDKPANGYRILGLGDSFSYANGVELEDTYFKRIQRRLTESSGRPVEIINCAAPAYGLIQETGLLKKLSPSLKPDAALIGFYVGNDFIDSYNLYDSDGKPAIAVTNAGGLVSIKLIDQEGGIRGFTGKLRQYLATNSHLYVFLRNRLSELLSKAGLRGAPPAPDFCAKEYSEDLKKGWELDQRLLLEAKEFTQRNNMRLIVVVLPAIYQVYEDAWTKYFTTFKVDPNLYDLNKPQTLLNEFCQKNGIEIIDMLPGMRREGKSQQLFFPIDTHMNPEGHRVVADSLTEYFSSIYPLLK